MYPAARFFRLSAIMIAAVMMTVPAAAQELRGRVQGVVSDPSGAVIPAAQVTLNNVNTNAETVRETNEVGQYVFDFVLPGTYELTVELEGFRTFVQQNRTLKCVAAEDLVELVPAVT